MGCILQDLFTKVNILLPRQWGHPVDQAIYLLKFQEISNRIHWTDPSIWVSNISSDLLTGLLVRSHSIFDGQVWINIKQVHLASLLTFWKLKPGIPSYRGSIWFHLLKLAGMTNAASSWRTRLAAWLCGKYFGPRVYKKNTNIQGFGVEASGKLFCLSPGSSAQRIAPAVGGVLLEIGGFSCQSSRLNPKQSRGVNFHGSELPDLFGRFPSACPLPHLQGQQYVRIRFHHTELFKMQTVAWQNCNKLLVHLLVDSLTSRIGKQLFWWVMKSWRLTGRIATLQSQVISEYLRFTRDSMFLKFWSNLKAPSKQKPRCFRSQSSLIQII